MFVQSMEKFKKIIARLRCGIRKGWLPFATLIATPPCNRKVTGSILRHGDGCLFFPVFQSLQVSAGIMP